MDEANKLSEWVAQHEELASEEPPVSTAAEDLAAILEQDTEPDPDGHGTKLKRGVAKDRMSL